MKKMRALFGLLLLITVSAVLVPLFISCSILVSESMMTPEQYIRMNRASSMLSLAVLSIQIFAAWLIHSSLPQQEMRRSKILRFMGVAFVCVVCSLVGGFLLSNFAEHRWYQIATDLFK